MQAVVIVIHLILAVALSAVVLLQKSEGGALGIGGGGGMGGFMTGRGAANFLTRATAILAAAFMVTSIALAYIASHGVGHRPSIFDQAPASSSPTAPAKPTTPTTPASPAPSAPKTQGAPSTAPAAPQAPTPPIGQ
ncbi:MAG TPA: preprotein translocase subunit SecG [Alphaproteobacteria bacterium]|nr:preprotein translocase subunit SecG [Alphaproteobacteria bacterium]